VLTPEQHQAVLDALGEYLAEQQELSEQFVGNAYSAGRSGVAELAGADVVVDALEGARLASLQDTNFDLIVSVANSWIGDIQSLVGDAYLLGESPVDIAGRLSAYFERMPGNWSVIARDQVAKAQYAGRNATYAQIGQDRVEITVAPDACEECDPFDGDIVDVDDEDNRPQYHIQCACMDVPTAPEDTSTSDEQLGEDQADSEEGDHGGREEE
jgi:hypothetical protein